MPAFRLDGRILVWHAAWKAHVSMYPMTAATRRAVGGEAGGLPSSKGTIRFPLAKPASATLVKRLVKARVADLRGASRQTRRASTRH